MKTAAVIVNAASGKGHAPEWAQALEAKFAQRGIRAKVTLVEDGGAVSETVKAALAEGVELVVAGGGDGTINQVASQLLDGDVPLGVLPLGTLNHFAKDLGIPLDIDEAIAVIALGHARAIDVGEVNGRLFLNNSSIGLYPDVVHDREHQQQRLGRGKWLAFCWACVSALRRFPFLRVRLKTDGEDFRRRTAFVFIGNNEYAMAGLDIGSRARLDAGTLSVYASRDTGRLGIAWLALSALFGRTATTGLEAFNTETVVIETGHRRLRVATDGEVEEMQTPLQYRSRPAALRVLAPVVPATGAP